MHQLMRNSPRVVMSSAAAEGCRAGVNAWAVELGRPTLETDSYLCYIPAYLTLVTGVWLLIKDDIIFIELR